MGTLGEGEEDAGDVNGFSCVDGRARQLPKERGRTGKEEKVRG